jgi:hypothetical protein
MKIICVKKCLDKNGDNYVVGDAYHYYETCYVYDSLGIKLYDIYHEEGEERDGRIHMGIGNLQFIRDNFFINNVSLKKIFCTNKCITRSGRTIYNYHEYYYKIDNSVYGGDENVCTLYERDQRTWLGYVKCDFISNNFIEWSEYELCLNNINNLFNCIML